MAVSRKGDYPNHLGLLALRGQGRMRTLEPLVRGMRFNDRDFADNVMWNDWFFGQSGAVPVIGRWNGQDVVALQYGSLGVVDWLTGVVSRVEIYNGTFEVDTQNHVAWYSATVTRSTAQFQAGAAALSVETTDPFGSGVQLDNFPYFTITEGTSYTFSCWHRYTVGATGLVTWGIQFRTEGGVEVGSVQNITFTPSTTWAQASNSFVAPATATRVSWTFSFSVDPAGPILWLDNVLVDRAA